MREWPLVASALSGSRVWRTTKLKLARVVILDVRDDRLDELEEDEQVATIGNNHNVSM